MPRADRPVTHAKKPIEPASSLASPNPLGPMDVDDVHVSAAGVEPGGIRDKPACVFDTVCGTTRHKQIDIGIARVAVRIARKPKFSERGLVCGCTAIARRGDHANSVHERNPVFPRSSKKAWVSFLRDSATKARKSGVSTPVLCWKRLSPGLEPAPYPIGHSAPPRPGLAPHGSNAQAERFVLLAL